MGGQYGVDQSKKIAQLVAQFINVGCKVIKGNLLSLFELVSIAGVLRSFDFDAFKKEVLELDADERTTIQQAFAMALDLPDNTLEQKIADAAELLNEAVDVVVHALSVFDEAKLVVKRFEELLGG